MPFPKLDPILEAWGMLNVLLTKAEAPEEILQAAAELGVAYINWRDSK